MELQCANSTALFADSDATSWWQPQKLAHLITNAKLNPILGCFPDGWHGLAHALGLPKDAVLLGIPSTSLPAREQWFGHNYVAPPPSKSLDRLLFESAFLDRTNLMLLCAGVVSLLLGILAGTHPATDWVEGTCVIVAVTAIVMVTALTELKKERQFQTLNAVKNNPQVHVIRDGGMPQETPKWQLVVGDIVVLHTGDIVPADGLLLRSQELRVDESAMAGEAEPVSKYAQSGNSKNVLLSGTTVVAGSGTMVVLCVGEHTQEGMILRVVHGKQATTKAKQKEEDKTGYGALATPAANPRGGQEPTVIQEEEEDAMDRTPLALKLETLNLTMGKIGALVSTLLFLTLSIKFSIQEFAIDNKQWNTSDALSQYVNFFILAVTTLVVAIPEGLPLAVIIALTYSVRQMLQEKCLVRHLYACETAGNATIICSDKTGTLTTNQMTVTAMWVGFGRDEVLAPQSLTTVHWSDSRHLELLMQSLTVNSSAELLTGDTATGSPTESALLRFVRDAGHDYQRIRDQVDVVRVAPFSSDRKCMTTIVKRCSSSSSTSTLLVLTKGAPESVLACCSCAWRPPVDRHRDDAKAEALASLTDRERQTILDTVVKRYATRGCRTLCLAYKEVAATYGTCPVDALEDDLVLLAVVAIEDPIRPEVPRAIALCKSAGVTVCIVTGDNILTATSIARQCGIIDTREDTANQLEGGHHSVTMDAVTFRGRVTDANGLLIQSQFDTIWPSLRVLARATPLDKYLLVCGLMATQTQTHGAQLVAVTGDGTNDAAALKKAHIGFAMGQGGTEVAKRASDIVVLDDNFMSIVNAIKWGRNVYDSIVKFLQFQLTMIIVAVTMAVVTALFLEKAALTAVQILWINLFMDAFVSVGLATEKPTNRVMERKPYQLDAPLLSSKIRKHIFGQCVFQLIVLLLRAGLDWPLPLQLETDSKSPVDGKSPSLQSTMVFNTFAWMQLFNQFNCRRIDDELNVFEGLMKNRVFLCGWVLQATLQFVAVQYGSTLFHAVPLTVDQWAVCIASAALTLPLGVVLRMIE